MTEPLSTIKARIEPLLEREDDEALRQGGDGEVGIHFRAIPGAAPGNANLLKLKEMKGCKAVEIHISKPVLSTQLDRQAALFMAEVKTLLGNKHPGENLDGLKCRYDFAHKRLQYKLTADGDVEEPIYFDSANLQHQDVLRRIDDLNQTYYQITASRISYTTYNKGSLTISGRSRSYAPIESSGLAASVNGSFDETIQRALEHYLASGQRDPSAQRRIDAAKARYHRVLTNTNAHISALEGQQNLSPIDKDKLQELKEFKDKWEKQDGYLIGHALLADVYADYVDFGPKTCSALLDERTRVKTKIVEGCQSIEEGGAWNKVKRVVGDRLNKSGPADREKVRIESAKEYVDNRVLPLMIKRVHHDAIDKGRVDMENVVRLLAIDPPSETMEEHSITYFDSRIDDHTGIVGTFKKLSVAEAQALIQP